MDNIEFTEFLMRIIEEKSMGLEPEIEVREISKSGYTDFEVTTKDRVFEVSVV